MKRRDAPTIASSSDRTANRKPAPSCAAGRSQLIASVGYFPEKYGDGLIRLAFDMLARKAVAPGGLHQPPDHHSGQRRPLLSERQPDVGGDALRGRSVALSALARRSGACDLVAHGSARTRRPGAGERAGATEGSSQRCRGLAGSGTCAELFLRHQRARHPDARRPAVCLQYPGSAAHTSRRLREIKLG